MPTANSPSIPGAARADVAGVEINRVEIDTQSTTLRRCAAVTVLILGAIRLIPAFSFTEFHNDFAHYYLGGSLFGSGLNPYTEPLEPHCLQMGVRYDPTIPFAAHPPLILLLFSGIAPLAPGLAYGVWLLVQIACLLGCCELTRRILKLRWDAPGWLFCVGIFVNTISVQMLFYYSQIQLVVGLICYGALVAKLRGKPVVACGLITLAAALKLYPAVLLPWFLFSGIKRPKDVLLRGIGIGAIGSFCLILPGLQTWFDFVTLGIPALSGNAIKWTNYSIQNLVLMSLNTPSFQNFPYAKLVASLGSLMIIGLCYTCIATQRLNTKTAFSLLLIAATVGGVITWSHYFVILLLPIAVLWQDSRHDSVTWPRRLAAYASGLVLLMPQVDMLILDSSNHLGRIFLHFYPLAASGFLAALLIQNASRQVSEDLTPAGQLPA